MKLYSVMCLYQYRDGFKTGSGAYNTMLVAENDDYALAYAVRKFNKRFPSNEGFFDLQSLVLSVSDIIFDGFEVTINIRRKD